MPDNVAGRPQLHVMCRITFVETDEPGFYIVSSETLKEVEEARNRVRPEDFGDLRRMGDLDELAEQLERHDDRATLAGYVEAIEQSVGLEPSGDDLAARFAAVTKVVFKGLSARDVEYPADSTDFRSQDELDGEWEDAGHQILAGAIFGDLPVDLRSEFCVSSSDMFGTVIDRYVPERSIVELIKKLKEAGYDVLGDVDDLDLH